MSAPATAWAAWDGLAFMGSALPPYSGNHLAELAAIAGVLARREAGDRVLIMSDCQGALTAIESCWRSGSLESLRNVSGGALIEDIIRHRLRICGPDATGHVVFMYTPARPRRRRGAKRVR